MSLSEPFIRRPVMTTLVMASILFLGMLAYQGLPVSDLPDVEYPTIEVTTSYPGAGPQAMADTVTSPLERQFTSIEGIETIASSSTNGSSTIVLQFNLDKDIDAAATDVQSAINQAQPNLPADLPNYPTYKKTNPSQTPVLFLSVSSDLMSLGDLYDYAYALMGRRLGMVNGVSDVDVYGSPFAVRVQVDPDYLSAHQIGINEVANSIVNSNPELPVGNLYGPDTEYTIQVDGQMETAAGYNELIVRNNNQALLKVKNLGNAINSLQNDKYALNYITKEGEVPCVVIAIVKEAGANTIKVIEGVKDMLEEIKWELPTSVKLEYLFDQSAFIMESVHDVELTLIVAFILVVLVVLFYLGKFLDTVIPILALPMSVVGTFALMFVYGFSIDILSLLALTLSIGFLVDDAIVVLENIHRHVEMGKTTWEASLNGSKQISFTILSMTLSLACVFIPLVFMDGIMGRMFREFAITIVTAVLISGFISLSLTPMLCSRFVSQSSHDKKKNWIERISDKLTTSLLNLYKKGLNIVFKHRFMTVLAGCASVAATIYLGASLPTDFIPGDDLGFVNGFAVASDPTSPYKMIDYQNKLSEIIKNDPNVQDHVAVAAIPNPNQSLMFIRLKPFKDRASMTKCIQELLPKLQEVPGVSAFLRPLPLINLDVGTSMSMGNYQYTLQSTNTDALYEDVEKILNEMRQSSDFTQVISNMHNKAPYLDVHIDRDRAYELNVSANAIESTFEYAYSGGRLSLINGTEDQYYVIIETVPSAYKNPTVLDKLYVSASTNTAISDRNANNNVGTKFPTQVPLSAVASWKETVGPLSVAHINTLPAVTISYDLGKGVPLGTALSNLNTIADSTLSSDVHAIQIGSSQIFQQSFASLKFLFVITIFAIYVILGILYENFIHPLTVMSAIPPAALGAIITLIIFGQPLSLYAFIGIIMLLGIVLKNGIMLVDFANEGIREGKDIHTAIYEACCARFRPILMTTFAAMMGAVPIALGIGGSTAQSRRPLGMVVVGGLIISQILTLYFTPIIFTYLEGMRQKFHIGRKKKTDQLEA
ncbi:efflux RND transporter permease subunit [Candidatus Neptunichlamydia sp. REUL1]|uniref:efflux RND transporter permease subunit n=1 Tax=Candidatus Neptunichlamydia sp. REUL1 TaxID=3064277 RepID=UPI00292E71D7|nr:efflux RND transporter permease subunit [Candidatus Neptunochlamydia sp. REUL1]